MSDTYELLKAGSTVTGDTWTMLNNLGGGGIGQVVESIAGLITVTKLEGIINTELLLKGSLSDNMLSGNTYDTVLEGSVVDTELEGEI